MKQWTYTGKTALITGASSGIGEVFARALAGRGMNLLLVARSEDKLNALAGELGRQHGIRAEVIAADLSDTTSPEHIYAETQKRGLNVDLLVNNAGFATHGAFEATSGERQHEEIMVNVTALVDLTHLFLSAMLARGDGGVINVASTAGFLPLPYMAVYGATKAFVLSFSEALWGEYQHRGVRVLALCPGATDTAFFEVVGTNQASVGRRASPQAVVEAGLRAFEQGRLNTIPGAMNVVTANLPRILPRRSIVGIIANMYRPKKAANA